MDTAGGFPDSVFALTGEPAAIGDSGVGWSGFARTATEASADLRGLNADTFIGDEADLYRARINTNLPPYLDTTADAWHRVAAAVTTYSRALYEMQTELAGLRGAAHQQWCDAATATATADRAAADDTAHASDRAAQHAALEPGATLPPDTYQPVADRTRAAADADAQFQATVDRATTIRARHDHAVDDCVRSIEHARDLRFADPPGWLGQLWQSACDWVADHVDVLQALSAVLKQISGIAAMLTFIPVIGPLAGAVAVTAGGLAVGIDATIKLATGEGDWAQISIDALSMIPGARAAKAVIIADTTNSAVHVATGDIDITDAAFALAANAGMANIARSPTRSRSDGSAWTHLPPAGMGRHRRHAEPAEVSADEHLLRNLVPPPSDFTAHGFEVRYTPTATAFGSDVATLENLFRSRGYGGRHDLIAHGTPSGELVMRPRSANFLHPRQAADHVLANTDYSPGQPVNMVVCHGGLTPRLRAADDPVATELGIVTHVSPGTQSLAQEFADYLQCDVYGSEHEVQLDPRTGRLLEIPDPDRPFLRPASDVPIARPTPRSTTE